MKKELITSLLSISVFLGMAQTHDYAKAQHLSTYFLGAQRCGDTKSWIQPEGAGGCHTTDGQAVGHDLTGGWHDCGDYIKFHVTGPYTALVNLYGYYRFPEAYPDNYSQDYSKSPGNGIPDILDEVKIETDYLIKCVNGSTIYWQVGDGRDHNSFKEPISNSAENLYGGSNIRPVFSATDGHSNAFGSSAAALALMSILYQPYDNTYAQQCLAAAQTYYTVGKTNPAKTADAVPGDGFYAWLGEQYSEYNDEMGMGAAMLYVATNTSSYLSDATSYASTANQWGNFGYGSIDHLLLYEMYKITGTSSYLTKVESKVQGYNTASCGYIHLTQWGSLRDASNAALLAALYHIETGNAAAYTFAKSNVDFILGSHGYISADAPANFSFLIGYNELGGSYPQHPHHGPAFGKSSNDWSLFNQEGNNPGSVPFEYELKGGLAGGPEASCANFYDKIDNYISSEYCSYYNAAFTSAVAYINKVENSLVTSTANVKATQFFVFPNPASETVVLNSEKSANYAIYDSTGRVVFQGFVENQKTIDVGHFNAGHYVVKNIDSGAVKSLVIN